MGKKAQVGTQLGGIILLAVALIVGVILIQASANNVAATTNTVTVNQSLGVIVVNNTVQYVTNLRQLDSPVVYNQSNGAVISAGNYTITSNVNYNGNLVVSVLPLNVTAGSVNKWVITGTGTPTGYISDTGGRSMANLIILLSCVALVVIGAAWAMKAYNDKN